MSLINISITQLMWYTERFSKTFYHINSCQAKISSNLLLLCFQCNDYMNSAFLYFHLNLLLRLQLIYLLKKLHCYYINTLVVRFKNRIKQHTPCNAWVYGLVFYKCCLFLVPICHIYYFSLNFL